MAQIGSGIGRQARHYVAPAGRRDQVSRVLRCLTRLHGGYDKYRCSKMKRALCLLALLAPLVGVALQPPTRRDRQDQPADGDTRLPNGKSQQDEILKAEHEKSLKDAAALIELAEQLKADLEKNDRHVLSIATLKKTEEIE